MGAQLFTGLPSVSTYAPRVAVEVAGRELAPDALGDVLAVSVTLQKDALADFQLTINNWDSAKLAFKYSDTSLFDLGNLVHIKMGYADELISVIRGVITRMTPRFPSAGPPTIGVAGQDSLVLLRDRKPKEGDKKKWTDTTNGDIARDLAQRNGLVPQITDNAGSCKLVFQRDLDDAQFLMERAKQADCDCFLRNDPTTGIDELYFKPPSDGRGPGTRVFQFQWGQDLLFFNPELTISRQVSSVEVRGWDPKKKEAIVGSAKSSDLAGTQGDGDSGPGLASSKLKDKQDIVVDRPVHSKEEADQVARAMLRERAYTFGTATGQCIGRPEMRPGDNIQLSRLGKRFDGDYHVTKVTHDFGANGFLTEFAVRRVFDGGLG